MPSRAPDPRTLEDLRDVHIEYKNWKAARDRMIVECIEEGFTEVRIAQACGMTGAAINKRKKKLKGRDDSS